MRRTWVALLLGGLLALGGLVVATPASACSCAGPGTTQEFFDGADAVFTGTLVSREVSHPGGSVHSSGDPALHVFAVDTVFKGTAHERQGVVSADSGASCGLELSGAGPFVVFATRSPDPGVAAPADDQYAASLCGGTAPADAGLAAELTALAGTPRDPSDGSAAPLPSAAATEVPGTEWGPVLLLAGAVLALLGAGLFLRGRALRRRR